MNFTDITSEMHHLLSLSTTDTSVLLAFPMITPLPVADTIFTLNDSWHSTILSSVLFTVNCSRNDPAGIAIILMSSAWTPLYVHTLV